MDIEAAKPKPPVRVLHIINGEFYSGGERVQDLLALRLPEFGYETVFACVKKGIFAERRESQATKLYSFPMSSKLDLKHVSRLARLARRERFRLLHTHSRRTALIGQLVSAISGIPMVHHLHSPSNMDTEQRWRNVRNSVVEKISLLRAEKLIPVSRSLERYLLDRGYRPGRIRTVCNGVPAREKLRRPIVAGKPVVVGTVALFRPRKGIEILLEALARLRRARYDLRLHAVGPFETREYEEFVLGLVKRLDLADYVKWTGFTEDVSAELARIHLFVLPSLFGEGMPMVVLEAMAVGLPVVSTRVEGIPEVVEDGHNGLLVGAGNVAELEGALRRLLVGEVDPELLGDRAWCRQREKFSATVMAEAVAGVYREVLGE